MAISHPADDMRIRKRKEKPAFIDSLIAYPIASAAEGFIKNVVPDWDDYGILPEIYTSLRSGSLDAANFTKHFHGQNLGDLPENIGFQNLYSVYRFKDGSTKINKIYVFRRPDGLETPIGFDSDYGSVDPMRLVQIGDNSIGKEREIGSETIDRMLDKNMRNGDWMRAGCYAELTDMDTKRTPDPTQISEIYAKDEIFLAGQKGKRNFEMNTLHGQIWSYEVPGGFEKIKHYAENDFRYTFINAPIQWLDLEEKFDGLGLQRLYEGIARKSVMGSQKDMASYGIHPTLGAYRADGFINPVSRFL